jgi:pyrroline-5-carboxylate reductase
MLRLVSTSVSRNASLFARRGSLAVSRNFAALSSADLEGGVFDKIACIGAGKMAQAVLEPVITSGLMPADKVSVFDVSYSMMEEVQGKLGVTTSQNIAEVIEGADLIICAVKPQNLTEGFFNELHKGNLREDSIFLSVLAGKTIKAFESGGLTRIVRSM